MRINHYFYIAVLLLFSCVKESHEVPPTETAPQLSLDEARAYFESGSLTTRSGDEEENLFTLGYYAPRWDEGELSTGDHITSADAPVEGDYRYYVAYGEDAVKAYPLHHQALVVKENEGEQRLGSYLLFYIPDSCAIERFPASVCAQFLNCGPKDGFSGLGLYTTPEGAPRAAARYLDGELVDMAFLGDTTIPAEQSAAHLSEMLSELILYRCPVGATRTMDPIIPGIESTPDGKGGYNIEGVACFGKRIYKPQIIPLKPNIGEPTFNPINLSTFLNSGGKLNTNPNFKPMKLEPYDFNSKIKVRDKEVEENLDLLMKDCMGRKLIELMGNETTISRDLNARNGSNKTTYTNPPGKVSHNIIVHNDRIYTLLEELIHAYQRRNWRGDTSNKMNHEVEAKLGWLMYLQRTGQHGTMKDAGGALGGKEGTILYAHMSYLYRNGRAHTDPSFAGDYIAVSEVLRDVYPEYNKKDYPMDYDNTGVPNLDQLMKDCLQNK